MSLLTKGKGKKGEIEMLLQEGKSDEEIVKILDTSKSYVQKVKSQSKSNAVGKTEVVDRQQDEGIGKESVMEINEDTTILPEKKPLSTLEEK